MDALVRDKNRRDLPALPVFVPPTTRRPMILVADYLAFVAEHTYADDRVRPIREL
jgi:hypothetical protein